MTADGGAPLGDALVVIPTLNEERYIERCLSALMDGGGVERCRFVVADGGSTDATRSIVDAMARERPNLALRHNPGRIQSAALNLALEPEYDRSRVLVRCDAHAVYPPDYVAQVVASLRRHGVASVVVPMDAVVEGGCFQRGLGWVADTRLGAGGSPHRGGTRSGFVDHGHHAGFDLDVFRALGGYDTAFPVNEDAEFDRRLRAAGHRIWLDAEIRIGYVPRSSPGALARQYFRYGDGRARTCLKHAILPRPRQAIPILNLLALAASLALVPFSGLGLIWPGLYLALLLGVSAAGAAGLRSVCGLWSGVAAGIIQLAWGLGFLRRALAGLPRQQRAR